MNKYQFKTNINCSGCLSRLSPVLNNEKRIENWEVDLKNPSKILTIITSSLSLNDIIDIVMEEGFNIEFFFHEMI